MVNEIKSFRVGKAQREDADVPVVFRVCWSTPGSEEDHVEEFKAYIGRIPDLLLYEIPNMEVDLNSVAMIGVFKAALGEEFARFHALLADPNRNVLGEEIAEILAWFAEERIGRPTTRSTP